MVTISVPLKTHLIGEHSVVYYHPAIIGAIDKRIYISAEPSKTIDISSSLFKGRVEMDTEEMREFLGRADKIWEEYFYKKYNPEEETILDKFLKEDEWNIAKYVVGNSLRRLKIKEGVDVSIDSSSIMAGSGVGSSAAIAVGVAYAISKAYELDLGENEMEITNIAALTSERIANGKPSGGDNSACCYGGLTWFKKIRNVKPPRNVINKIDAKSLGNFSIAYTKKREQKTSQIVADVGGLDHEFRESRMNRLGKLTYKMKDALKNKKTEKIAPIMNEAQKNLEELTVSSDEIDVICEAVDRIGGGAKLSGAGRGGYVICYHPTDINLLNSMIKDIGYESSPVKFGAEGVRLEM